MADASLASHIGVGSAARQGAYQRIRFAGNNTQQRAGWPRQRTAMAFVLPDGVDGEAVAGCERLLGKPEPRAQRAHILDVLRNDVTAGGENVLNRITGAVSASAAAWRAMSSSVIASTRRQSVLARSRSVRKCDSAGMALTRIGLEQANDPSNSAIAISNGRPRSRVLRALFGGSQPKRIRTNRVSE